MIGGENMRKTWFLFLICFFFLLLGCENIAKEKDEEVNTSNLDIKVSLKESELWNSTIKNYLKDDLWVERDRYDASHVLMVPLHYAFQSGDQKLISDFETHFDNFIKYGTETIDITKESDRLSVLSYYYLLSEYIVLAKSDESKVMKFNVDYLAKFLLKEIERIWHDYPAWQWGRDPFIGGMKEKLIWKLDNKKVGYSYYRAVIDEELFVMAIASDLSRYFINQPVINDIKQVTYRTFKNESNFDKMGRWLFQIGVWSDHVDYAYVGYDNKNEISDIKRISNISTDSSHFHRFPLGIKSFINSYPKDSTERNYFIKINKGLEKQLFDKVLVEPNKETSFYKMNNFMDGRNGLYRWNYSTVMGDGYGPYELSGTFSLGWWTFLGSERIKRVYLKLAQQYPLSQETIDIYVGPNTSRERNPYVNDPDSYRNGIKEILAILASKLK